MKISSRLPAIENSVLGGHRVDRQRPLTFFLNGGSFSAFDGDTLLSALLANGITTAGTHAGQPLGLSEGFVPWVRRADVPVIEGGMPMDRVLVTDQARYESLAPHSQSRLARLARRLSRRSSTSLNIDFDASPNAATALIVSGKEPSERFDLIVVGGGVCGMAASLAAAREGLRTALVERRFYLGGDAEIFGGLDDETPPAEQISSLRSDIARQGNITVLVGADAFRAENDAVWVHLAGDDTGACQSDIRRLEGEKLVLATGTADRLPVFGGNRLPGVIGLSAAYHLGAAYGVWPEGETVIWGATNVIYRLGIFVSDAERHIKRIIDARVEPQSRFREFAKAYGIHFASGLSVDHVVLPRRQAALELAFRLTWGEGNGAFEPVTADRLVVCNGWMPRLRLWRQRGGTIHLAEDGHFIADGSLDGVRLAGSAAGYQSMSGCMESGVQAVRSVLGQAVIPFEDKRVSETFESADAPVVPAPPSGASAPAYLDTGASLSHIGGAPDRRLRSSFAKAPTGGICWLSPADVSGLVGLGRLNREEAAAVLLERAVDPIWLQAENHCSAAAPLGERPSELPFLSGRFGSSPQRCEAQCEPGRRLEPGSLVYAGSDSIDPAQAVGVILMPEGDRQFCLIDADYADADYPLIATGTGGSARITLVGRP